MSATWLTSGGSWRWERLTDSRRDCAHPLLSSLDTAIQEMFPFWSGKWMEIDISKFQFFHGVTDCNCNFPVLSISTSHTHTPLHLTCCTCCGLPNQSSSEPQSAGADCWRWVENFLFGSVWLASRNSYNHFKIGKIHNMALNFSIHVDINVMQRLMHSLDTELQHFTSCELY